jgi:uncharacterized protein (DUF849 family)
MTVEERLKPCGRFMPEVAPLNMGSMNFGLYPMLSRFKDFQHAWKRTYLEGSKDRIFTNRFKASRTSSPPARRMARGLESNGMALAISTRLPISLTAG